MQNTLTIMRIEVLIYFNFQIKSSMFIVIQTLFCASETGCEGKVSWCPEPSERSTEHR